MESMIVASFSVAETARKGRKVTTENPAIALSPSGPTPLPPAGVRPKPAPSPSLAARAHVNLGHAVGIAGETHFLARQFRHPRYARAGHRAQVFPHHRPEMGVPDAGAIVP